MRVGSWPAGGDLMYYVRRTTLPKPDAFANVASPPIAEVPCNPVSRAETP